MEEKYITFETAELAKAKGFNIPCNDEDTCYYDNNASDGWDSERVEKPTQDFLSRWLRHKHHICLQSKQTSLGDTEWTVVNSWAVVLLEPVIHMYYDGYPLENNVYALDGYEETLVNALNLINTEE